MTTSVLIPEKKDSLGQLSKLAKIGAAVASFIPGGQPVAAGLAAASTLGSMASQQQAIKQPMAVPLSPQRSPDVDSSVSSRMQDKNPMADLELALAELNNLELPEPQKNIYRRPILQAIQKGGFV